MKKIFILLLLILSIASVYYSYPIIKNRYFPAVSKSDQTENKNQSQENNKQPDSFESNPSDAENNPESTEESLTDNDEIESISIDANNQNNNSEDILANITNEHCDSECKAFANNFEHLEYCQQVCGISPAKKVSTSDCKEKKDLAKDYCFKDLAISKKDFSICDKIKDSNIKDACKNRITQDIIEKNK